MENALIFIEKTVCGAFLPALLFLSGAVFLFRIAKHVFSPRFLVRNIKGGKKGSLASLWLALGGTLGVGNICGVCAAIYVGGAGCVFWIWVCAFLSAATKYAETVLAVHYRELDENGNACGGAPSYMKKGLGLKILPTAFCVLCIFTAFTMGNLTQISSASELIFNSIGIPKYVLALFFGAAVLILTLGKGRFITAFTSKSVPLLCCFYTAVCAVNIFVFRSNIAPVTRQIISEALTLRAGAGGFVAFITSPALRLGITRGVMSNEAGCGTAPIAYAADKDAEPLRSGILGTVEVLVDTLLLCTLTAYAVLLPGIPLTESSANTLIAVFSAVLGRAVANLVALSVGVFALASVSAWAFYSMSCAKYLHLGRRFNLIFAFFYSFTSVIACFISEGTVWTLADISVSAMAVINVLCVTLMFGTVKKLTENGFHEAHLYK